MLTPIKAIRAKCLDCCCDSAKEVAMCPCPDCSLYPYRFGKNPNIKREVTPKQLASLENARISKKLLSRNREKSREAAPEGNYTPDIDAKKNHGTDGQ